MDPILRRSLAPARGAAWRLGWALLLLCTAGSASAQVVSRTSDGVRVSYEHQVVGPVTATLTGKAPPGDTFAVRYDLDDPYRLRWADDASAVCPDSSDVRSMIRLSWPRVIAT